MNMWWNASPVRKMILTRPFDKYMSELEVIGMQTIIDESTAYYEGNRPRIRGKLRWAKSRRTKTKNGNEGKATSDWPVLSQTQKSDIRMHEWRNKREGSLWKRNRASILIFSPGNIFLTGPHVFGDRVYVYGFHNCFNGYVYCLSDYAGRLLSV